MPSSEGLYGGKGYSSGSVVVAPPAPKPKKKPGLAVPTTLPQALKPVSPDSLGLTSERNAYQQQLLAHQAQLRKAAAAARGLFLNSGLTPHSKYGVVNNVTSPNEAAGLGATLNAASRDTAEAKRLALLPQQLAAEQRLAQQQLSQLQGILKGQEPASLPIERQYELIQQFPLAFRGTPELANYVHAVETYKQQIDAAKKKKPGKLATALSPALRALDVGLTGLDAPRNAVAKFQATGIFKQNLSHETIWSFLTPEQRLDVLKKFTGKDVPLSELQDPATAETVYSRMLAGVANDHSAPHEGFLHKLGRAFGTRFTGGATSAGFGAVQAPRSKSEALLDYLAATAANDDSVREAIRTAYKSQFRVPADEPIGSLLWDPTNYASGEGALKAIVDHGFELEGKAALKFAESGLGKKALHTAAQKVLLRKGNVDGIMRALHLKGVEGEALAARLSKQTSASGLKKALRDELVQGNWHVRLAPTKRAISHLAPGHALPVRGKFTEGFLNAALPERTRTGQLTYTKLPKPGEQQKLSNALGKIETRIAKGEAQVSTLGEKASGKLASGGLKVKKVVQSVANLTGSGNPEEISKAIEQGRSVRLYRGEAPGKKPGANSLWTPNRAQAEYFARQGQPGNKTHLWYVDVPASEAKSGLPVEPHAFNVSTPHPLNGNVTLPERLTNLAKKAPPAPKTPAEYAALEAASTAKPRVKLAYRNQSPKRLLESQAKADVKVKALHDQARDIRNTLAGRTVTENYIERLPQPHGFGKVLHAVSPDGITHGVARAIESLISAAPPSGAVNIAKRAEAASQFRSFTRGLRLGKDVADELVNKIHLAQTIEEAESAVRESVKHFALAHNVNPDELLRVYNEQRRQMVKATEKGIYSPTGAKRAELRAQLKNLLYLPDREDLLRTIHDLHGKRLRPATRAIARAPLKAVKFAHGVWKFTIVTGLASVFGAAGGLVGGAAGLTTGLAHAALTGEKESIKRGLVKGALIGEAVGSVIGGAHYIGRVSLIEELGVRSVATHGLFRSVRERIPFGWATGLTEEKSTVAREFLRANRYEVTANFERDWSHHYFFSRSAGPAILEFSGPTREEAYRAWAHAINYQVNDADPVINLLMPKRFATEAERERARLQAAKWLEGRGAGQSGREGPIYFSEMAKRRGFKKPEDVVNAAQRYLDQVITTPQVLDARLRGAVSVDSLKALPAQALPRTPAPGGRSIPGIHGIAQKQLNPFSPKDFKDLVGRSVLQAPTNVINRFPYFRGEFYERYRRYLAQGMEVKQAAEKAGEEAIHETNEVMFRLDGQSRFAQRADLVLPFQQVREEVPRVYVKIFKEHPYNVLRMVHQAALQWNHATNSGIFQKDSFGSYVMKVPGSALLSRLLGLGNRDWSFHLASLSFFSQGAYNIGLLPSPGGLLMNAARAAIFNSNPELVKDMPDWLAEWVAPYGFRNQTSRASVQSFGHAIFGAAVPWEIMDKKGQADQFNNYAVEVYKQQYLDWQRGKRDSEPTLDSVKSDVRKLFGVRALLDSILPATVQFSRPGKDEYETLKLFYKDENGQVDYNLLRQEHPEFIPYTLPTGEFQGPEEFWTQPGAPKQAASKAQFFKDKYGHQFTLGEFKKEIATWKSNKAASDEYWAIQHDPDKRLKYSRLADWEDRHPELAKAFNNPYIQALEYAHIAGMMDGPDKDKALKDWRFKWKASVSEERRFSLRYTRGAIKRNIWADARSLSDIRRDWNDAFGSSKGRTREEDFVKGLSAAEAVKFYRWRQEQLTYSRGASAKSIVDQFKGYNKSIFEVTSKHPELFQQDVDPLRDTREKQLARFYAGKAQGFRDELSRLYNTLNSTLDAKGAARDQKAWTQYKSLKHQADLIQEQIRAVKNSMYAKYPDLADAADTVREGWAALEGNDSIVNDLESQGLGYLAIAPEESQWAKMNDQVRQAYLEDLKNRLTQAPFTKGKVFWDWLTDFQRDLFTSFFGEPLARQMALDTPELAAAKGRGFGGGAGGELGYALSLFRQYSKRTGPPPAAYREYLALRNSPAARLAFLKLHPEVADYIRKGPLANMPPLLRNLAINIMVKYGKWQGEERSISEITEISFAEEQLQKWTKRKPGEHAPATLDVWMKLPSGAGKAAYLRAHPEIQDWFARGPMAQMPDNVKDVVREIMVGYGLWTEKQDPLSKLATQYFQLPASQKGEFLQKHPELVEYWRALRSPEDRPLFDLATQYFSIPDAGARRFLLESHPELRDYFVRERQRRYERFLNRVAFYLNGNPELVQGYLAQQTDILKQLLDRFGERPLLPENVVTKSVHRARRPIR